MLTSLERSRPRPAVAMIFFTVIAPCSLSLLVQCKYDVSFPPRSLNNRFFNLTGNEVSDATLLAIGGEEANVFEIGDFEQLDRE